MLYYILSIIWYNICMESNIYIIIFYLLLIDSIGANLMAWSNKRKWYHKHFRIISRYFPIARGWSTYYLVLVIFIGFTLYSFGVLTF